MKEPWSINWDFMFEAPEIHEDDSCESCHESHISEGDVVKNASHWPAQFPCCVETLEDMKNSGEVCPKHPLSYFEEATKDLPSYCEDCQSAVS